LIYRMKLRGGGNVSPKEEGGRTRGVGSLWKCRFQTEKKTGKATVIVNPRVKDGPLGEGKEAKAHVQDKSMLKVKTTYELGRLAGAWGGGQNGGGGLPTDWRLYHPSRRKVGKFPGVWSRLFQKAGAHRKETMRKTEAVVKDCRTGGHRRRGGQTNTVRLLWAHPPKGREDKRWESRK